MQNVATKQANAWGWYDMHGNVFEFVQDVLGNYPNGTVIDPTGAGSGGLRVDRGGCWFNSAENLRSASRSGIKSSYRHFAMGFRVVRVAL